MESRTMPPPQASARKTEMGDVFNRVLFSALDALQENQIPLRSHWRHCRKRYGTPSLDS